MPTSRTAAHSPRSLAARLYLNRLEARGVQELSASDVETIQQFEGFYAERTNERLADLDSARANYRSES
jgi:hypothetical protein